MKNVIKKVFLDTEFTDFRNPRMISFALVAEDESFLYCELDGWKLEDCSDFVKEVVLPRLQPGQERITTTQARKAVCDFIESIGTRVVMYSDSVFHDELMFLTLFENNMEQWPSNLERGFVNYDQRMEWPRNPQEEHNALNDAMYLKNGYFKL